jgi:PAS domain S-box-containing protein
MKPHETYLISLQEHFVNLTKCETFADSCYTSTTNLGMLMGCDFVHLYQYTFCKESTYILLTELEKEGICIPVNEQGYYAIPKSEFGYAEAILESKQCFFSQTNDITDLQFQTLFRIHQIESVLLVPIFLEQVFWGFWAFEYLEKTSPPSQTLINSLLNFSTFFANWINKINQSNVNKQICNTLNTTLDATETGVWHIEVGNENMYFFSDFIYDKLGVEKSENQRFDFNKFQECLHPQNKDLIENINAYLRQDSYSLFQTTFQIRHQNGQYIWLRSNGKKIMIHDKLYFFGTITVITKSEVNHLEQAKNNHQINDILKHVSDSLFNLDASYNFTYVSPSWQKLLGFEITETIGKSFFDFISPFYYNNFAKYISDLQLEKKQTNIEIKLLHKNKEELWVRMEANCSFDNKLNSLIFSGSIYPAHQEITAKQKLQENKKKLNRIIETIQDIIYTYAYESKKCIFISPSIKRFGINMVDFIGNDSVWKNLIHSEDSRIYNHAHKNITVLGEFNINYRINIKGEIKWINERSWLEKDEIGSPIYIHGILTDITELQGTKIKLEQSEKYFRTVFDKLPSPLLLTSIKFDSEIIANRSALKAIGITDNNKTPLELKSIVHTLIEANKSFQSFLTKSAEEVSSLMGEFLLTLPNQQQLWFNAQTQPINNQKDLLIVLHCIQEQKLAESELNERNLVLNTLAKIQSAYQIKQEYSKSLSTTLSSIVSLSHSDYGVMCTLTKNSNSNTPSISSIRSYQLNNQTYSQNKETPKFKNISPFIFKTLSNGKPFIKNNLSKPNDFENFMGIPILKNGKTIAILGLASNNHTFSLKDANLLEPLIGGYANFMEAIQINKERKQNQELYTLVSENGLDVISLINPELKITYISPSIYKVLGYNPEELLNKNPIDFFGLQHFIGDGVHEDVVNFTSKYSHKNGKIVILEVLTKTIYDKKGNIKSYLATARDVTIRVQILEELQQSLHKEKEVNKLKSRFVSMTSHEFRTPIATILSSTEIAELLIDSISDSDTSKKMSKHMMRIKSEVNRLTTLLNDILVFEKQATGKYEINRQEFNLNSFFHKLSTDYYTNEIASYRLIFDSETKPIILRSDQQILSHIISNLIDNALKYSPVDAKVYVNVTFSKNNINIHVKDNGIGVPQEDIPYLFDSFYRASNASSIPGTGLGLAIAKQFSNLLGASISYHANEPYGSIFSIHIPINHD